MSTGSWKGRQCPLCNPVALFVIQQGAGRADNVHYVNRWHCHCAGTLWHCLSFSKELEGQTMFIM